MAPESKTKKRKSSGAAPSSSKKKKFVPPTSKPKSPAAAAPAKKGAQSPAAKNTLVARKKAADFYSDDAENSEDEGWTAIQEKAAGKSKKGVKPVADKKTKTKESPAKPEKAESGPQSEDEGEKISLDVAGDNDIEDADSSADEELDDQTATLLKGFESSDEEDEGGVSINGKAVVKAGIPDEKAVAKKIKGLPMKEKTTPGIIYLGRIPHGFYEHEMKQYFSQFGTVTRLRLSRNKKTGQSKHYAFIEFNDEDVAQIAADTMNNYLLFGHILKCRVVPRDNLEYVEKLFKGANKRFKKIPVAKLAKAAFEKKRTEEEWSAKIKSENSKRKAITQKLKAKGIDYEFDAPVAKKAKTVAIVTEESVEETTVVKTIENNDNKEIGDTIQVVINTKESTTVKESTGSQSKTDVAKTTVVKETVPAKKSKAKKATKSKKSKA
ncbi:hypothetical protein EDC01DRAFT_777358 [Geopyxis carbonaria]|nr:hypothetical protein EDC01DRAFT_777358 [Geopyxis carbonaria]